MFLRCYLTIPRRVKKNYNNLIDLNENENMFKDLIEVTLSYDWFPYEYIDADVNNKLEQKKYDSEAMKWKKRLNITWNLSITIPNS